MKMGLDETEISARASLGRILLYVHDIEAVAEFYFRAFGFRILREDGDRIVELESPDNAGSNIMLHPLGRGRKAGQTLAKLVFDCPDVGSFCARASGKGVEFGPLHKGEGYVFANTKDPAGNSVSVSSRLYRHLPPRQG
jgi:predicted enzyme related to lactoylglutathione lyase